jgi:hypothetical protein
MAAAEAERVALGNKLNDSDNTLHQQMELVQQHKAQVTAVISVK